MRLKEFQLERFFARHEFEARYLLCCSDCESFSIQRILSLEPGIEGEFHNQWLGYTDSKGSAQLRKEIASLYKQIEPRQVLVHSGAQEAIFGFMNGVLDPGDHVIVESPCYQSLKELPAFAGAGVSLWALAEAGGCWKADINELERLVQPRTRALVINSPHNPTGYHFSSREMEQLVDFCRSHRLILFADEVYQNLEHDPSERLSAACDLYENAVSLNVMSKAYGLAGLRIGWIATRNGQIYEKMAAFKDYTTICNSAPSEFLARIALRNRRHILERNNKVIQGNLQYLKDFMKRQSGRLAWCPPRAGPLAMPRFQDETDARLFGEQLLARKGVLLVPGGCFDMSPAYFRIGFGRMNFKESLDNFEEYLDG